MHKKKYARRRPSAVEALDLSAPDASAVVNQLADERGSHDMPSVLKRYRIHIGAVTLCLLIVLGAFAGNGWLPHTDALTGKNTGWFGTELPKNAASIWNPFAVPPPFPTPSLSKEMIYAGSRLLTVEDKLAKANPPTDLAVWRGETGTWYVLGETQTTYQFGQAGDKPVPGDFDGDGKTDFAVYRPNTSGGVWYITKSSDSSFSIINFGSAGDLPAVADFDGDGKTDLALWRTGSNAYWYVLQSSTGTTVPIQFGTTNDLPDPADYDGDGVDDIAVWRGSINTFYVKNSSNGQIQYCEIGADHDLPASGDYDGDGKADCAVFRGSDGTWRIKSSLTNQLLTPFQYGQSGDVIVPNDYDADGKVDMAVWRDDEGKGYWYIHQTSDGEDRVEQWGQSLDIPVPAFFRR